jgi:hypothetical protein
MAELASTAQDPSRDFIRATPRNPVLGYLSDLAGSSYSPQRTQQMQSVAQFFNAPAVSETLNRMAYGEPLTTGAGGIGGTSKLRPEVAEAAMSFMDFLPTSGIAKSAAVAAPMVAGMFIGKKAATWDALAAAKAKMLADMGTDARTIWKETGTWKGPDGKWRQEIDDSSAFYDKEALSELKANNNFNYLYDTQPLGGVLEHKKLYQAYPDVGDIPTHFMPTKNLKGAEGSYSHAQNRLTLADIPSDQKSIAIHETQHAIQGKEGFARGGSPSSMILALEKVADQKRQQAREMFKLSSANDPLDPLRIVKPGARKKGLQLEKEASELDSKALIAYHSEKAKFDLYQRLGGEAEARATQARMNMTPEQRRAMFPEESYDVPMNELIIRTD